MRYRRQYISESMYKKSPFDFQRDNIDLDPKKIAVVTLWMLGGYTKKEAWSIIYKPDCSPNSIPPQVSIFFGLKEIKDIVRVFRYVYISNPYINPKALNWEC